MNKPSVYLAGPITGSSWGDASGWRRRVKVELGTHIAVIDPLRAKQYLSDQTSIADQYDAYVMSTQKGITTRDHFDVMRCDVVLANLTEASRVSIGTVMEIAWAHAYRKPLILVEEAGGVHDHAMIREAAGFIVPSLADGIVVVKALLLP